MTLTVILFILLGIIAIASAIVTIASKNPVVSAMALVVHFFMLAGLYLTLQAQFVAIIQILVYAGAIMVLVLFVIMLLNLGDEEQLKEKFNFRKILAVFVAAALALVILTVFLTQPVVNNILPAAAAEVGTAQAIGSNLFSNYLLPFEAVSLLLLAAIVGAVILAKRKID